MILREARLSAILIFLSFPSLLSQAQTVKPVLKDGVISYLLTNGERTRILIDKPCADLWVSPDESVIAFITMDKVEPVIETEPLLKKANDEYLAQSSVHIAYKSEHFKPILIALKPIHIRGMQWNVVREPSLSPDLKTLHFTVPSYMTSWTLLSMQLPSSTNTKITDLIGGGYCVIWGGRYSGDLLLNLRQYGKLGVEYPCFHRDKSGKLRRIAENAECAVLDNFAPKWSKKNGGVCQSPEFTQIW